MKVTHRISFFQNLSRSTNYRRDTTAFVTCLTRMTNALVRNYNRFMALWILFSSTWMSRHQKGKTRKVNVLTAFIRARDSGWQWHQLGHMQICTLPQTITTLASQRSVFYRPDVLPVTSQQHQSTEGRSTEEISRHFYYCSCTTLCTSKSIRY